MTGPPPASAVQAFVVLVEIREAEDPDDEAIARLFLGADDARVVSADGIRHMRRMIPERARRVVLVADADGAVVAVGNAELETSTTTKGAAWAFVTVEAAYRRRGIGDELGRRLLDHLHAIGATRTTSFFRWSEEGERWATSRGWSLLLRGPLIALDPRSVPEPSVPTGYRCLAMAEVAPEAVYKADRAASRDEPGPIPADDLQLDDFLRDWNHPNADLESSTAVLDEHRGRGLATAAKQRTLRTAAARGITRVTTSIAEENEAMRAINRKLGFEPIGERVIFGRDL